MTKWYWIRPSGARSTRSNTSTRGPTLTSSPVSSSTSRARAASSVSPSSTVPPGRLHSPFRGGCPRLTRSTRSPSTTTAPTLTTGCAGNSLTFLCGPASERQRRICIQIERRGDPRVELAQAGRGDHGRIVGGQLETWHERRNLARVAVAGDLLAEAAVCRHAASDPDAHRPVAARRVERAVDERRDDDPLEAGTDVGDFGLREQGVRPLFCFHVAHHRRLQPAEAEIEIALQLRSVPIRVR